MENIYAGILGSVIGAAFSIGISAFIIRFMAQKLANFKPTYNNAFLAALLGYLADWAIYFMVGFAVGSNEVERTGIVVLFTLIISFFAQAATYSFIIKGPEGATLGYQRACVIEFVEFVVFAAILWVASVFL